MMGMCPTTEQLAFPSAQPQPYWSVLCAVLAWDLLPYWDHTLPFPRANCLLPYQLLSGEDVSPAVPSCTSKKQLWLFAREAEADRDFEQASLFYRQVREPQFFPAHHLCGLAQHSITAGPLLTAQPALAVAERGRS